jgi:hypothetical protein
MQADHGGKTLFDRIGQKAIQTNFLAATFECKLRLNDGEHEETAVSTQSEGFSQIISAKR